MTDPSPAAVARETLEKITRGLDLAVALSCDVPLNVSARKELSDAYTALAELAAVPVDVDFRGIALTALQRGRKAGESQEMIARWISEDIHAALSTPVTPTAVQEGRDQALEALREIVIGRLIKVHEDETMAPEIRRAFSLLDEEISGDFDNAIRALRSSGAGE